GLLEKEAEALGFARWIQRISESAYIKLWTQSECVALAFTDVVGHSISGGYDDELPSLRYKIDPGFIEDGDAARCEYWRRFVAMQLRRLATDERMVFPAEWRDTGHPFMDLYYEAQRQRW